MTKTIEVIGRFRFAVSDNANYVWLYFNNRYNSEKRLKKSRRRNRFDIPEYIESVAKSKQIGGISACGGHGAFDLAFLRGLRDSRKGQKAAARWY